VHIPLAMNDAVSLRQAEVTANNAVRTTCTTTPGNRYDEELEADGKADEQPPTPPPPLALEIQSRLEHIAKPGAFHVAPGNPNGDHGSIDDNEDEAPHAESTVGQFRRGNEFGDAYLVEAALVQDPEPRTTEVTSTMLVEAQPLRRWNVLIGIGGLLIVASMVGVTLGVVLSGNRSGPPSLTFQPSLTPSGYPTAQPSFSPTLIPSGSPSTLPSSAPTPVVLLAFRNSLPRFTIVELSDPSSPQSRALEWIAIEDRERSSSRRMTQRFALATLYFSTTGQEKWESRQGWLNATINECDWVGCDCTDNETIRGLNLVGNHLVGAFPKEVSLLQDLETLLLSGNARLRGTLPSEIGLLTTLRDFEIGDTNISGRLPAEIGSLTRLETLYLSGSLISGVIPMVIGQLSSLAELSLFDARMFGPIPRSVGLLSRLTSLILAANQLSSTIPVEVGNLSSLSYIDLSENALTGAIPLSLWQAPVQYLNRLLYPRIFLKALSPLKLDRLFVLLICRQRITISAEPSLPSSVTFQVSRDFP
jgi:Leucine-rich repeat (LRR) protein